MALNLQPLYPIHQQDESGYMFITDSGVEYTAYFIDISDSFGERNVYSFSFEAKGKSAKDERIRNSIISILSKFFQNELNVMLMVCDSKDRREEARFKLFQRWYTGIPQDEIEKIDIFAKQEDYNICSSLFISRKHPRNEQIKEIFQMIPKIK